MGPSGCGKTSLAAAAALEGLETRRYDSVLITRINKESGNPLGFLKGSLEDKMRPWI